MDHYRLSHSFFMSLKQPHNTGLIFHKRLSKPIKIDKWKSLSHLKLSGFRCWTSALLKENGLAEQFEITVTTNSNIKRFSLPFQFSFIHDYDLIIAEVINLLSDLLVSGVDFDFKRLSPNVFFFDVLKGDICIEFGKFFCSLFGFDEDEEYDIFTGRKIFYSPKSFRDLSNDFVGISVNFGYNDMIDKYEIIGILSCENLPFMNFFDINVIDKPLHMNIKFEAIYEIEVKFIDLSNGQLLKFSSCLPEQEIFITISFSEV